MNKKNNTKRNIALLILLMCAIACFGTFVYYLYPKPPTPVVADIQITAMDPVLVKIREKLDSNIMKEAFYQEIGDFDELEGAFALGAKNMRENIHLVGGHPFFTKEEYLKVVEIEIFFIFLYKCLLLKISVLEMHFKVWEQMLNMVTESSQSLSFEENIKYQDELYIISDWIFSIKSTAKELRYCMMMIFSHILKIIPEDCLSNENMWRCAQKALEMLGERMRGTEYITEERNIYFHTTTPEITDEVLTLFYPVIYIAFNGKNLCSFLKTFRVKLKQKTIEKIIYIMNPKLCTE
ncbi:hypothetical protein NEFER03_1956 [Nematocida sp. LUAm3]|nr:hypothetical protein NEFER03_1956 [Nematocida sp. LUAm3]KAI5176040.1 hypothetical protein NEFER02_1874 [Nematocida sp. LUAm2]KAI5177084.1 hypothetical protein NEFER01_0359 [Nematocida sp. LUAm1]